MRRRRPTRRRRASVDETGRHVTHAKDANREPAGQAQAAGGGLVGGKLEAMLRDAKDGLNAVTIAKQTNARDTQVRDLLRELEAAGQVRRTGAGRASRWRLVTDEQRIAERAAELEARSTPTP